MVDNIFANARAVAAETGLLGADRLNRMADCDSPEEAFKILSEVNFGDGANADVSDYERSIEAEEKKLAAFIREVSPDARLTRFLLAENDYHNAEAIMRSKYLKTDFADMLTAEGLYGAEFLKEKIFSDDYKSFSPFLAEALLAADNLFVSGRADGKAVSALFRRALYRELSDAAKGEKLLSKIFVPKADAANIAVAFRARDAAQTAEMRVEGGTLTEEDLRFLSEENAETVREKYKFSPLKPFIDRAAEDFAKNRPLSDFERFADGYALEFLKKEKYSDEGYRPFLLYCLYKRAELKNVRIVMSCLTNGLSGNFIKERIRESYEG